MSLLSLSEAAEYLDISEEDLMLSFYKGLAPGSLGRKVDGELKWDEDSLLPPSPLWLDEAKEEE